MVIVKQPIAQFQNLANTSQVYTYTSNLLKKDLTYLEIPFLYCGDAFNHFRFSTFPLLLLENRITYPSI